jgi:hypothetical protein
MSGKREHLLNPFQGMPGSIVVQGMIHGYIRDGIYPVDAVLSRMDEQMAVFNNRPIKLMSTRYHVFARSLTCVSCGIVGAFFAMEKNWHNKDPKKDKNIKTWHFNLYAIQLNPWKEVLMTQDHIVPRAYGGTHSLDNLQTMCSPCNARKGCGTKDLQLEACISSTEGQYHRPPEITREQCRVFRRVFALALLERLDSNTRTESHSSE